MYVLMAEYAGQHAARSHQALWASQRLAAAGDWVIRIHVSIQGGCIPSAACSHHGRRAMRLCEMEGIEASGSWWYPSRFCPSRTVLPCACDCLDIGTGETSDRAGGEHRAVAMTTQAEVIFAKLLEKRGMRHPGVLVEHVTGYDVGGRFRVMASDRRFG